MVHTTGWLKGLRVTADGTGIVSHAGVALIRVARVAPDNRGRVVLCHQRLGVHGHHRSLSTYTTRAPVPPAWAIRHEPKVS
jgi:hypothetical protein